MSGFEVVVYHASLYLLSPTVIIVVWFAFFLVLLLQHPWPSHIWPCSSVGRGTVIHFKGHCFHSHLGQSFSLFLCEPISMSQANASIEYVDVGIYGITLNTSMLYIGYIKALQLS